MERNYLKLGVWKMAMELATTADQIASNQVSAPPRLNDILRDTAICIPANIAEGSSAGNRSLYVERLLQSRGALARLDVIRHFLVQKESPDEISLLGQQIAGLWEKIDQLLELLQPNVFEQAKNNESLLTV